MNRTLIPAIVLAMMALIRTTDTMTPSGAPVPNLRISQKKRRKNRRRGHIGAGT